MNMNRLIIIFAGIIGIASCGNPDDNSFNIFSIEDDIALGAQVDSQITASPSEYPLLSEAQHPEVHEYVRGLVDSILNSGNVFYKDDFAWETKIIQDDETLNAFCTPGGYIYVYTGLIKFLDAEHQLAGVLAHEVAHADRRHSTDQLTKQYGISALIGILLGENPGLLAEVASNLISLQFSRSDEREADEYSVKYLCPTTYQADGAAAFFEKIGESSTPEFLSTHPDPENRVEDIQAEADEQMCLGEADYKSRYAMMKALLP